MELAILILIGAVLLHKKSNGENGTDIANNTLDDNSAYQYDTDGDGIPDAGAEGEQLTSVLQPAPKEDRPTGLSGDQLYPSYSGREVTITRKDGTTITITSQPGISVSDEETLEAGDI